MNDIAVPEEFLIIGAGLELTSNGVRLKNKVTNDDIKKYMKKVNLPLIYDNEPQEFEYYKLEDGAWVLIKQPPLNPQLVHILLHGV